MWKWPAFVLVLTASACSTPSSTETPPNNSPIALEGGSTLVFEDGGALDAHRDAIVNEVRETVAAVRRILEVNGFTLRVDAGTSYVIPEIGLGGRTIGSGVILLVVDPASCSVVRYTPLRPFVLSMNTTEGDLSHLEPPKRTRRRRKVGSDAAVGGGAGARAARAGGVPPTA